MTVVHYRCSSCVDHPPAFARARSAFRYRGGVTHLVQALKYGQATYLGDDLAIGLEAAWKACEAVERPDLVTCVPLHRIRSRERGYNQAALLAQAFSRRIRCDVDPHRLLRRISTPTQTRLNAAARACNVKGAFMDRGDGWTRGRRIILVDDVMTTGATIRECARVLREAGAVTVWAITVARG